MDEPNVEANNAARDGLPITSKRTRRAPVHLNDYVCANDKCVKMCLTINKRMYILLQNWTYNKPCTLVLVRPGTWNRWQSVLLVRSLLAAEGISWPTSACHRLRESTTISSATDVIVINSCGIMKSNRTIFAAKSSPSGQIALAPWYQGAVVGLRSVVDQVPALQVPRRAVDELRRTESHLCFNRGSILESREDRRTEFGSPPFLWPGSSVQRRKRGPSHPTGARL